MIFESETCLYVNSMPKHQIHKKSFWFFQNRGFFPIAYFFSGKTAILQISADFVTGFENFFFHLKALQTRMQIDEIFFFVAQVVPEIYMKNDRLINSQIHVFASHCITRMSFQSIMINKANKNRDRPDFLAFNATFLLYR